MNDQCWGETFFALTERVKKQNLKLQKNGMEYSWFANQSQN
ncbi:hypothetical protein CCYN49044_210016 [Capnocytophaga cynodegmi]|uniref:Uncharacterized protein n=1 Tax=Capnocytophaga cynodegmi TaxID=28189 RepID=A0A0B7HK60_9FLAO|nr:hypothetical protein CCYN74_30016 [Capnocytophaga cynodegmi]CEN38174.1 hypothetical protein CCYN49044_210016 [Capnocytophaga cynodegmi]